MRGFEMWCRRIVLTSSKTIVIKEDGSNVTVTIPADTYYNHNLGALETVGAGGEGLWHTIQSAIDVSALVNTYVVEAGAPSQSVDQAGLGFVLRRSVGALTFKLDLDASTFDLSYLGFTGTGLRSPIGDKITGDFCLSGRWHPMRRARLKDRIPKRITKWSTQDLAHPDLYLMDKGSRKLRMWDYNAMPAANILKGKGLRADYAQAAHLAAGDEFNAFEWIWDAMSDGETVLVQHDIDTLASVEWEEVKLYDPSQMGDVRSCLRAGELGGEWYGVQMITQVLAGNFQE